MKKVSQKCSSKLLFTANVLPQLMTVLLMAVSGLGLETQNAAAQSASPTSATALPNIIFERNTGEVRIDRNAFEIGTGNFSNTSNIPLPEGLVGETTEGVALPVRPGLLAPNSIEFGIDTNYVIDAFDEALGEAGRSRYQILPDTLQFTKEFNINHSVGNHDFGEGIEVIVTDVNGLVVSRERAFVRGDVVQLGPGGEQLPENAQITVEYGATDTVELRVFNIQSDNATPTESAIYFDVAGDFVVEDMPNGGDRDFNDGNYVEQPDGQGEAIAAAQLSDITIEETIRETPLDPLFRTTEVIEQDMVTVLQAADTRVQEERDWGQVELSASNLTRLGHARGAVGENGEPLIYDRYSASNQFSVGSNGAGISGQLKPLVRNPKVPPTLLFGNANFDPFVGNNEAGLVGTLGVTQFLSQTHREATDMFGGDLPTSGGNTLLEPTGLFHNRRLVGYVPPTPDETVLGEPILSVDGVFEIPETQQIAIAPADANVVGRGNAAYTRNVGGVLIESPTGELAFIPQWTESGYASNPITLEAGEAKRIIYALVPQQPGQNLQLNQRYAVVDVGSSYRLAEGNFRIISADRQPQNFQQERPEVYAVEDTLPGNNAVTTFFNGIQGIYIEPDSPERVPTVDADIPEEADARVGNELFSLALIPGNPGQMAYSHVTRAGGFYVGGALTGGIGNQEDQVRRTITEMQLQTDEMQSAFITNTFQIPLRQVDSIVTARTVITNSLGTASFDVDNNGELTNARFVETGELNRQVQEEELERISEIVLGEETQIGSAVTDVTSSVLRSELIESDRTTTESSDAYANVSALVGELAMGGVFNFGNTPWTQAANTLRAELFARDAILGRSGSETGWRAELLFHPFGEVKQEAFQYDAAGNVVPVYKTEPVLDVSGQQRMETLTKTDGDTVVIGVNQFVLDEQGDRIVQKTGTGVAKGPGIYIRVEDAFGDDQGLVVAGGFQFAF